MKRIALTQGKFAVVDDLDFIPLSSYKWFAEDHGHTFYAATNIKASNGKRLLRMHRMLVRCPRGFELDHIDGNGLNNTRNNLRIATRSQNLMNRKRKGVIFKQDPWRKKKWTAAVYLNGKRFALGYYLTEQEARAAYEAKARELHGDFAYNREGK